jgi:hypothetical protein
MVIGFTKASSVFVFRLGNVTHKDVDEIDPRWQHGFCYFYIAKN